jgi:PAS domain S-box-containing protein
MEFTKICQPLLNAYTEAVFLLPLEETEADLFADVNDAAVEIYGYSRQEFKALGLVDITAASCRAPLANSGAVMSAVGIGSRVQVKHRNKVGLEFPVEITISPLHLDQCSYRLLTVRDLTVQSRLERALAANEAMLNLAIYTSPDVITLSHLDGTYSDINESFTRQLGYRREEVIGKTAVEMSIWERQEGRDEFFSQLREKGFIENLETDFVCKDGTVKTGLISGRIGEIRGVPQVCTYTRDITERKQIEDALRYKTLFLEKLTGAAKDGIVQMDHLGRVVFWNSGAEVISGYSVDEMRGRGLVPIFAPTGDLDVLRRNIDDGSYRAGPIELKGRHKDGHLFIVELSVSTFDLNGKKQVMAVIRDVTERKRVEEEMVLMNFALDHISEEVHLSDECGRFVYANRIACESLGYSKEELIAMSVPDIDPKRTPEHILEARRLLKAVKTIKGETVQKRKDGTSYPVEALSNYFEYSGNAYNLALVRDISERKNTEEELRRMGFALDHISEEVHLSDDFGRLVYINDKACRALGYSREELIGMKISDIDPSVTSEILAQSRRELAEHKTVTHETVQRRHDGSIYPVEVTGNHFEYAGTSYSLSLVRDISERKRIEAERRQFEQQMVQAQKLESLEVLAGGVAHDFNNLIAAIMGHAELTKRRLPPDSPAAPNLQQIEQAAERAADLARQMLAYSGKGRFVVETIDLNRLLEESLHMLKVSVSRNIDLRFNPCNSLPGIDADATQIRQIVMNLILNAAEAIGNEQGRIVIKTEYRQCDEDYLRNVWFKKKLPAGSYVVLEVADSGCGMDEETLAKLFDPFFTTKFTGRGLGMSAVMGIVRGHKGAIRVESEKGRGTIFKVLLPASGKKLEAKDVQDVDDGWQGSGTVLLVDDEAVVRTSCTEMLEELGFTPLTAGDGYQALEVFKAHPEICLVLLDLTMPNLNGEKCLYELQKLDPQVKVIISSGYSESEVAKMFADRQIAGFLHKPYRLAALRQVIRAAESTLVEAGL